MSIILPNATLGVTHPLGEIMTADLKNGVVWLVRGNLMVLRIFKDGRKFYEVEFGDNQADKIAEFTRRGADMLKKSGGSGLPEQRLVQPALINPPSN